MSKPMKKPKRANTPPKLITAAGVPGEKTPHEIAMIAKQRARQTTDRTNP